MSKEEQFLSLPYILLSNKELKDSDKITLALIYSFHNNKKKIYMSNTYIGNKLGISRTAASERISKLERLGYIRCDRLLIKGKERRTIVPLRMVSIPNGLVGKPNRVVGEPNGISRSTEHLLVGEVGSIKYLILDNILNKVLDNLLDNTYSNEELLELVDKAIKKEGKLNLITSEERGFLYQERARLIELIKQNVDN